MSAGQFGNFTYQFIPGGVEITDYPVEEAGTVDIPAQIEGQPVISIGLRAFYQCSMLSSITMPSTVNQIGSSAFAYCYSLSSINIPESVTTIESRAFFYCLELTEISIPAAATIIGDSALSSCTNMTSITVDPSNPNYSSTGGVLFNKSGEELIQCPCGKSGSYTVPGAVKKIRDNAFYDCPKLTTLYLSGNITDIGGWAFYNCRKLTQIQLPASLTTLGDAAFLSCVRLESIFVDPANTHFTNIGGVLFNKAETELIAYPAAKTGDYVVPPGVVTIKRAAFGYSPISGITLPASIYYINHGAFFYCDNLTHVVIPASVIQIDYGAFSPCANLNSAIFMGDAPVMGSGVFDSAAAGFAVYFLTGASGFSIPTWLGYPAIEVDQSAYPAGIWLLSHDIAYDTPLDQDLNGDGVPLLMAYAMILDPNQNLAGSMPRAVLDDSTFSISYPAGRSGVIYSVETSTNLHDWTRDGVIYSGPIGARVASVPSGSPQRFLRLKVEMAN